jgi:Protein of unknown function (DUF2971)
MSIYENTIPETLFHYCSVESMFHILTSEKLWLSNAKNMNDSLEFSWIKKHIVALTNRLTENELMIYYKDLLSEFNKIEEKHAPYVFCLSSAEDLLSQWRGYADDGYGVSIGFLTEALNIPILDIEDYYLDAASDAVLAQVLYNEDEQVEAINAIIAKNERQLRHPKIRKKDNNYKAMIQQNLIRLKNIATILKNDAFKEEQEWRIFWNQADDLKIKFRPQRHTIISYVEFNLKTLNFNKLITSITLGPNCKLNLLDLELFLNTRNPSRKIEIKKSNASYRASL